MRECRTPLIASTSALAFALAAGIASAATPEDADAIRALAEFDTYCAASEQDWGLPLCGPVVLVDPATRRAIANVEPESPGFVREGDAWIGRLPDGIGIANMSVDWNGTRWAQVVLPLPKDPAHVRALLAHEAFHRIQPALGFAPVEADNAHLESEHGRIHARLEIAALQAAVEAAEANADWRGAAIDALAYRAARIAAAPGAAAAESALLTNEGVAEYTGIRVGAPDEQTRLALEALHSFADRGSLIRSFGYVVGPAYGLLLDSGGDAWRRDALARVALPELLHRSLGAPEVPAPDMDAYDASMIVAEEAERAEALRERTATYTASLVTGPTVTFPFEAMRIEFDPNSLFALGPEGTIYHRATTIRDAWGELKASGEVLIGPSWNFARVPGPAVLDGNTLSGPGWTATLADGYELVAGDRVSDQRIRARP